MKKFIAFCFLTCCIYNVFAGTFTPGNIVVVRLGDGSAALSNASAEVFLEEYSPAGSIVQTISLPTIASGNNHAFTMSGTASSEGALTLSVDGHYLVLAGYDEATGFAGVATDASTNRTIATVDATGAINTATGINYGSAYVTNNFRGAATIDGTGFWCAGAGTGGTGGTWYVPAGSFTSSPVQVSSTISSTRVPYIFDGQLYTSSAASTYNGISSVGVGTPTTAGQTSTLLPGFSTASGPLQYSYYFFDENPGVPGVDVVYVADNRTASPDGGIYKFSLVSGTWVANGNIPSTAALTGITGTANCIATTLYASGPGGVYSISDSSGYNQTITGTLTQIVTAATNTAYRDIAFAPGTVPAAALTVNVDTAINITCHGLNNGSINISVTGGTPQYNYNWGSGVNTQNRNSLALGSYTVTVTDAGGCSATATANITEPNILTASAPETDVTCHGGSTGSINASASGGTGPYHYNWGAGDTAQNRIGLIAGTYTVTVSDNNSCTATATAIVLEPNAFNITDSITNLPCTGGNTGVVRITVTGGTSPYTYHWGGGETADSIAGLSSGTYGVTITDHQGCIITDSAAVSQSGSMVVTDSVTDVRCHGEANGAINVTATGGTPGYTFVWSPTATTQNLSALAAGNYTVTVADNGGCSLVRTIVVAEPAVLTVTATIQEVSCYGNADGQITLSVNGGTQIYAYSWSNSSFSPGITGSGPAIYTVTVTDNHGCTATSTATITQPDSLSLSFITTNASANGSSDGSIDLTINGGTTPYGSYNWSNGSTTQDLSGLPAGVYCVTVNDHNNCQAEKCDSVSQPTGINDVSFIDQFIVYSANGNLFINATLTGEMNCAVDVFDLGGRALFSNTLIRTSVLNIQVPGAAISSGFYLVRIKTDQGSVSKKIFITQ